MANSLKKRSDQLGINYSTATARLRKKVLLALLVKYGDNICYRCETPIQNEQDLSMEHKVPWLDDSNDLFWSLDNIAFSHLSCNSTGARKTNPPRETVHGTNNGYNHHRCRCGLCKTAHTLYNRKYNKTYAGQAGTAAGCNRSSEIRHGTNNGYNHHRCRCDLCKKAHYLANKKYRRQHGPD